VNMFAQWGAVAQCGICQQFFCQIGSSAHMPCCGVPQCVLWCAVLPLCCAVLCRYDGSEDFPEEIATVLLLSDRKWAAGLNCSVLCWAEL
jgi:hypothetical protein